MAPVDDRSTFAPWIERWNLVPDGAPFETQASRLLPVLCGDAPAILKIAVGEEEKRGGALMSWWQGAGVAPVLAWDGEALLLERAPLGSLIEKSIGGRDDGATRILCHTLARLHTLRADPPPLIPLADRFEELAPTASREGGLFAEAAAVAADLLAAQRDIVVLHGDMHHGNVLNFDRLGWLAIDPKGLIGERGFDYANIFCNPPFEESSSSVALDRFDRRVAIVSAAAALDRRRLLQWILAWAGLSASWSIGERQSPAAALSVAEKARAALAQ